jgi:hypothetical protein
MLGLGQSLQARLGLDPIADVPRDRDDPAGFAWQLDVLEQDFDRKQAARSMTERERDGPRL